jgi:hypothetical protein
MQLHTIELQEYMYIFFPSKSSIAFSIKSSIKNAPKHSPNEANQLAKKYNAYWGGTS